MTLIEPTAAEADFLLDSPGGSHEEHQRDPPAVPLHAARPLPELHQVSSGGAAARLWDGGCSSDLCFPDDAGRFRIEQPVYINIIRDPISRFLSNYFFRRFGDWRGEQNHLIRTPGMKDEERYLVRLDLSQFSSMILHA